MIISTTQEMRLHVPSNAVENIELLQGILDNSEKDFLCDKLGESLYKRLCDYYSSIEALDFYDSCVNGTYAKSPWATLLLHAQRMVANDALARFAYQQAISINSSGINVSSSTDYAAVDDKMLDKGVQGFRKEAMVSLNNMLLMLETWAKKVQTPMLIDGDEVSEEQHDIETIVVLWQESKYYFAHADLLIPTCDCLQQFIDIYDNRDKFIRLLPDIRFIQDEYIEEAVGEETISRLLSSDDETDKKLLRKVRRLMVAYLECRTSVLAIDKTRRMQAHDEAVSLKTSVLSMISRQKEMQEEKPIVPEQREQGFQNNQEDSHFFVSPLLY